MSPHQATWIPLTQVAELRGVTLRGARKWALKNAQTRYTQGRGRGGRVLEIALESLPEELRGKHQSSAAEPSSNIIPMPKRELTPVIQAPPAAPEKKRPLTPRQEREALARADLVRFIRDRKGRAKSDGGKKTEAARTAIDLYNNGFILHEVFEALGKVD